MASAARSGIETVVVSGPWVLAMALAALAGSSFAPARAQEPAEVEADTAEAEEPKLEVHGFLTQAYGFADDAQVLGITEDGTADYRTAALQMRYRFTDDSSFVAQISHERLGESPLQEFREDVEIDWLFYEHRWGTTSARAGKVPIPFGIWNEVRDVGTVLPFYRPPRGFYGEGAFTTETVDGLLLSRGFELGGDFSLDGDLYYGDRNSLELSELGVNEVHIDDTVGLQLWLSVPGGRLRFGAGAQRFEVTSSIVGAPGEETLWKQAHASVEALFSRFSVRAEVQWSEAGTVKFRTTYLQVGVHLSSRLDLNLQAERSDLELTLPGLRADIDLDEDLVAGVAYWLRPYLVIKAEAHRNEGFLTEAPVPPIFGPPVEATYGILSLSTSF